jgi:hypothetical protein
VDGAFGRCDARNQPHGRQGRAVAYEFRQIREDGGRIAFIAKPSGQPEASFALLKSGSREVVFENAAHDFPQRVMYRLEKETRAARTARRAASTTRCAG